QPLLVVQRAVQFRADPGVVEAAEEVLGRRTRGLGRLAPHAREQKPRTRADGSARDRDEDQYEDRRRPAGASVVLVSSAGWRSVQAASPKPSGRSPGWS